MAKNSSVARRYGESWTGEDGGRWRPGTENAVRVLRAAGYSQVRNGVWVQTADKRLPSELTVAHVEPEWPHACTVEVSVL